MTTKLLHSDWALVFQVQTIRANDWRVVIEWMMTAEQIISIMQLCTIFVNISKNELLFAQRNVIGSTSSMTWIWMLCKQTTTSGPRRKLYASYIVGMKKKRIWIRPLTFLVLHSLSKNGTRIFFWHSGSPNIINESPTDCWPTSNSISVTKCDKVWQSMTKTLVTVVTLRKRNLPIATTLGSMNVVHVGRWSPNTGRL